MLFKFVLRMFFKSRSKQGSESAPSGTVPRRRVSASGRNDTLRPNPWGQAQLQSEVAMPAAPSTITGKCYVIDGDTIQIGKVRLRLAGIDAPELEHPWGKKAKWELVKLCKGQEITAEFEPTISYDRVVATCLLPDGRDLSAEMVRVGLALDWLKFSGGKYAHLEPEDARKKHWKAAARQRGHMHVFHK